MIEHSEAWQSFRDLNFKNPLESHFSFNKKCFVGRMVLIQSAPHFPDLGECFAYSKRMRTTRENVLRASEIKVFAKKGTKQEVQDILLFCAFFVEDFDFRSV